MKPFSDSQLKNLKPRDKTYEEHEGRGFRIRVTKTGKKTFYYVYRSGKIHYVKIGDYPAMSLKDARKRHQEMMEMRDRGLDPSVEVAAEIKGTFGELAKEYLNRHATKNKDSYRKGNEQILEKDVLPYWRNRPANQIRRADVTVLLDRVLDRGAQRQTNKVLSCIRKIFNFGLNRAWPGLEYNPCARMEPPGQENKKDRYLSEEEIRTFWAHWQHTKVKPATANCLKFILATGLRPGEALFLDKAEIDGDWLQIGAKRMKNHRPHRLYMNAIAKGLIDPDLPCPFPFPSEVSGLSQTIKRQRESDIHKLEIPHFTPHDLRRTVATYLGKLGYKNADIGIMLSHTDSSITARYNLHDYDDLKEEMALAWGKKLQEILAKPRD